jgi:acyl transferase domain-containing protein/thioesterase domain-containing protein/acyl carrier protein
MKNSTIAIVGMSGRFPGARNIDEFWRNLRDGVESIRPLSDAQLLASGVRPEELAQPDYVKAAAVLDGVDLFDASFFGFSPRDAAIMDPQHRHFLECSWEAIENAGHLPERFPGSIGVFAGSGMNSYMIHNLMNNRKLMESAGLFLIRQTGNDKDVLATRVSYQLDLHGPSMSVQTACSTSLVAVHMACQSLLNCECDMALAGGVTIEIPHARGYIYREGEILSRDGHCRSFDAAASGTVFSSGVGLVVLRRLEDAIEDHDTIHAVIMGSAVNNDGQRKVGYLAPSVSGQAEVITEALGVAGVDAESITYVETHGTGTKVGDPIEFKGLAQAFRGAANRKGYCAIGSIKTNIGHLDAAAGIAGLIKTVLALKNRKMPASLHFQSPNPEIDFQNSPFYVNSSLTDWKTADFPLRAGVTSLGIGGTNAHVVLEEPPQHVRRETTTPDQLILLSARTETALEEMTARLATHLQENPVLRLADVAFTSQVGRKAFAHRRIVVASNTAEAARLLSNPETTRGTKGSTAAASRSSSVVFLFSGQGSQYPNMGADLYSSEPVFRDSLDKCAEQLLPHLGLDLREILYPRADSSASAAVELNQTNITQPALFSVEYSLAQWWMAHGVRPQTMVGHSIGEYVAACLADVLSLDDALAITATRGRLMESCLPGSMLAVSLNWQEISLASELSIAAVNAPQQCVVSGPSDSVAELEQRLTKQGVLWHRLQTSHAFHSAMMEPIVESFLAQMSRISLRPPRIPYLSNLTGTWITAAEATDPGYWAKHLRNTVRFSDCTAELLSQPNRFMIEVGPGKTLTSLILQQIEDSGARSRARVISSLRRRDETVPDTAFLLNSLGQLWIAGQTIDWSALHRAEDVKRIPLPTYPFQRQRFWIEPDSTSVQSNKESLSGPVESAVSSAAQNSGMIGNGRTNHERIDQWFYKRTWHNSARPGATILKPTCWVVFRDPIGLGEQITLQLRVASHEIVEVIPGDCYKRTAQSQFVIRPGVRADYDALFADLIRQKTSPRRVVHLWSLSREFPPLSLDEKLDLSFYSLLFLAQSLGDQDLTDIDIAVVSNRLQSVAGEPVLDPISATLLGPTGVIPKEFPGITCRSIDIDLRSQGTAQLAAEIRAEHCAPFSDPVIAIRQGERWIGSLERTDLRPKQDQNRLKHKGVYVITGGLGDLGLAVAEDLARHFKARMVLLGRTPLPPAGEWKDALDATSTPAGLKQKVRKLLELESLGAEILCLCCDVCRRDDLRRSIETAHARFGSINGVIHAAGVVEDAPLQVKSRESASRVLAPKLQGTLAVIDALEEARNLSQQESQLDFITLFSSVSSVLAPAGQVDYVAANAFLDAYAASRRDTRIVAINWGPWRDIGMAARVSSGHPMLGRRLIDTGDEIVYSTLLSFERNWVLAEHGVKGGRAVLPGTSYLEMASAALTRGSFNQGIEFKGVFFHAPFLADPGPGREARVELRRESDGTFRFSIRGRDQEWIEYASGIVTRCKQLPPPDRDIDPIAARCTTRFLTFDEIHRTKQEKFFEFGPRWRSLRSIYLGDGEALAQLELPETFEGDTSDYHLHPALLDLATGAALYLIDGYGESTAVYLPMSYERARVFQPIPVKFVSHIRSPQRNVAGRDVATFDLTLLDGNGRVLVEIEGFSMRLIRDLQNGPGMGRTQASAPSGRDGPAEERPLSGIAPADGTQALIRIVSSDGPSSVFVLPDGLPARTLAVESKVRSTIPRHSSKDECGLILTELWKELLGLDQVGLDDDFFELGGHSLLAVRLLARIEREFKKAIPLPALFQSPTIRHLATFLRDGGEIEPMRRTSNAIVPLNDRGGGQAFYCVHSIGGEVMSFRHLSNRLGPDQRFYGIQVPPDLRTAVFTSSIESIAEYYVNALIDFQPAGSYLLGGWSVGSVIALEMAQQLRAIGRNVELLVAIDGAPPVAGAGTSHWNPVYYWKLLCNFPNWVSEDLLLDFSIPVFASRVRNKLVSRLKIAAAALRREKDLHEYEVGGFMELSDFSDTQVKFMGALFNALHAYRAKPYAGRVLLFKAKTEPLHHLLEVEKSWSKFVSDLEVIPVRGTHVSIVQEPYVRAVANGLKNLLASYHREAAQPAEAEEVLA